MAVHDQDVIIAQLLEFADDGLDGFLFVEGRYENADVFMAHA